MSDEKKLTDEEIVKALENCITTITDMKRKGCDECPYKEVEACGKAQMIDLLDLIHRLQSENKRLEERITDERKGFEPYILKNYELQKQVDELLRDKGFLIADLANARQAVKDTAKEIFDSIFEVLCGFTTEGKSEEYNKGFLDAVSEIDERLQKLAKKKGVEVE